MKQREPALDWPGILAEVHRRGMTMTELAKRNGLFPAACRQVRERTHFKAQQVIADFIGHKPEDLWPSRYPKGKPRILDTAKYPPTERKISDGAADNRAAA